MPILEKSKTIWISRFVGCLSVLAGVCLSAIPAQAQFEVNVDKVEYAAADSVVVRAKIPANVSAGRFIFFLVDLGVMSARDISLNATILQRGQASAFRAPAPGDYEIHMVENPRGLVAKSSRFKVVDMRKDLDPGFPGLRGSVPGDNATGSLRSRNGLIRTSSKEIVLGAQIEAFIEVPPSSDSEENKQAIAIDWFAENATDPIGRPGRVRLEPGPGSSTVKLHAPFERPGVYEIRLLRCPYYCSTLLDVLRVNVTPGRVPGAIKAVKTAYRPGEPIDVTITLPSNRYYYGHWSGPTVQLVPVRLGAKEFSSEDVSAWVKTCSNCQTWLSLVLGGRNPLDDGYGVKPVMLDKPLQIKMKEMAESRQIQHPIYAPKEAGRYEVRLYDRGFNWEWNTYSDLYIAKYEISVQVDGVPSEANPATTDAGSRNNTTTRTGVDGSVKSFNLTEQTDPDGTERVVETAADGHRIETVVSPDGHVVITESAPGKGPVQTTISADGRVSTVERDMVGNTRSSSLGGDGSVVTVHRDKNNQIVEVFRDTGNGWTEHINSQGDVRRVSRDADGRTTTIAVDRFGNTTTTVTDAAGNATVTDLNVVALAEPGRAYYEQVLKGTDWDALPKSQKTRYVYSEREIQASQERAAREKARDVRQNLEDLLAKAQREGRSEETQKKLAALRAEQEQADRTAAQRKAKVDRQLEVEQSYETARKLQRDYDNAIARGDKPEAVRLFNLQEAHHKNSTELLKHTEDELRGMQASSDLRSRLASEIRERAFKVAAKQLEDAESSQDTKDSTTAITQYLSTGSELQKSTSDSTRAANHELIRARASQEVISQMMAASSANEGQLAILRDFQNLAALQETGARDLLASNGRITAAGYLFDAVTTVTGAKAVLVGRQALKKTATAVGNVIAKRRAASAGATKTVTLVADDSTIAATKLVDGDISRIVGSDVLSGPAAPTLGFQVSRSQLARLHTPGRNLTATEIVMKAELHRLRHVAGNRFFAALNNGVNGQALEALRAEYLRLDDLIGTAIEAGRYLQ